MASAPPNGYRDPVAIRYRRKSGIAFGMSVIALVFILETVMADRMMPNPASPYVWTVLAVAALVSAGFAWWFHRKAAAARDGQD
jgi:hypothetical protein